MRKPLRLRSSSMFLRCASYKLFDSGVSVLWKLENKRKTATLYDYHRMIILGSESAFLKNGNQPKIVHKVDHYRGDSNITPVSSSSRHDKLRHSSDRTADKTYYMCLWLSSPIRYNMSGAIQLTEVTAIYALWTKSPSPANKNLMKVVARATFTGGQRNSKE